MSSSAPLGDRQLLETLFGEIGQGLTEIGAAAEIVMVGGSWLLWHTQRAATHDVDSAKRLDGRVVKVARRVSAAHGLRSDWLTTTRPGSGRRTPPTATARSRSSPAV